MNDKFAKSALAAGIAAAAGYSVDASALSLAPVAADKVILGCTVPSAGTTVATVYSVDAVSSASSSYTISLPTAAAVGQSCAGAIAALTSVTVGTGNILFDTTSVTPANFAIPGSGYSLSTYTFAATTTPSTATAAVGYVGCAAPGTTGATVYSVDSTNISSSNVTNIAGLNALVGKPCSYALAVAGKSGTSGFAPNSSTFAGQAILTINSNGYALNQYTFQ